MTYRQQELGLKAPLSNLDLMSLSFDTLAFTARCTVVQSALFRLHDVRPSVRLSVTLVHGSGSHSVNGPCLLDYLILKLRLPVVLCVSFAVDS